MYLQNLRWPDLDGVRDRIFVVPLGSMEQHGHHLPLFTDSLIVSHVAERVEKQREDKVVLLPVQWLGHSPHHRRFGCVSADFAPYVGIVCAICRSLVHTGARKILLLNGHGGNDTPCKAAQRELKSEFESLADLYIAYAAYWNLAADEFNKIRTSAVGGMGHACEMETSILLSTNAELVDMSRAKRGGPSAAMGYRTIDMFAQPAFSLINEFDEISENGVIGQPELATREKGELFLEAAVDGVIGLIDEMGGWKFQKAFEKRSRK